MPLAYLDTETTGLDPARHDAWCVAYAIDDGEIQTHALPHGVGEKSRPPAA